MTDEPTTTDWQARAAEEEARDAQATALLKRILMVGGVVLIVWIGVVVWSFHG
jgi:hypothetical protein